VTFRIGFDPLVKVDLAEAFDWYEEREKGLGERFLNAFEECVVCFRQACSTPERGPAILFPSRRIAHVQPEA